jgi:hypothetical protein
MLLKIKAPPFTTVSATFYFLITDGGLLRIPQHQFIVALLQLQPVH